MNRGSVMGYSTELAELVDRISLVLAVAAILVLAAAVFDQVAGPGAPADAPAAADPCAEVEALYTQALQDAEGLPRAANGSVKDFDEFVRLMWRAVAAVEQNPDCFTAAQRLDAAGYARQLESIGSIE